MAGAPFGCKSVMDSTAWFAEVFKRSKKPRNGILIVMCKFQWTNWGVRSKLRACWVEGKSFATAVD